MVKEGKFDFERN